MIDPVSSAALASVALKPASVAVERAMSDPIFVQLLQALVGPLAGAGSTLDPALQAAVSAAVQSASSGADSTRESPCKSCRENDAVQEGPIADGNEEGYPSSAIEIVLALISTAAVQLQPWQAGTPENGAMALDATGDGARSPETVVTNPVIDLLTLSPGECWALLKQSLVSPGIQIPADNTPRLPGGQSLPEPASQSSIDPLYHGLPDDVASVSPGAVSQANPDLSPQLPLEQPVLAQNADETGNTRLNWAATARGLEHIEDPQEAEAGNAPAEGRLQGKEKLSEDHPMVSSAAIVIKGSNKAPLDQPEHEGTASSGFSGSPQTAPGNADPANTSGQILATAGKGAKSPRSEGSATSLLKASVVEQIARRAQLISARSRTGISIQLEPKDLGKVRVYVGVGSDGLHVKLAAEARDTMGIIQASLPQLKEALANQGLKVDRFDLGLGSGFSGFNSTQDSGLQRQAMGSGQPVVRYSWDQDLNTEETNRLEVIMPASLIDYRI